MAFIEWNASITTGISEIDEQHAKLVGIVNNLHEAMKTGKSKEIMCDTLQHLIDYTVTHFATEENYFDKFKFQGSLEHKTEHKKLTQQVLEFHKKFKEGNVTVSIELMNFLRKWLTDHIKGVDMKYTECFRANGLR